MAETVYSGSVEPDQARTCEGNKRNIMLLGCHFNLVIDRIVVSLDITALFDNG
jgi:hypothetical protein